MIRSNAKHIFQNIVSLQFWITSNLRFSCGLELANLVVASDVLHNSWTAICDLYRDTNPNGHTLGWKVYPNHTSDTTIVAFVTSPICSNRQHLQEGDLVSSETLNGSYPFFGFLRTKNSPSFSIHKTAITLFSNFHAELSGLLKDLLESSGPLIITGHSLGGSIASLFTLWLLEKIDPKTTKPPLCITFGSPLIGDNGLQKSISELSTWNSSFLHVVSEKDPIARLLTPPHNHSPIIGYKPFGTFLLCSESGCACFDDSDSILELMVAMDSKSVGNNDPNEGLQAIDYTSIIEHLKNKTLVKRISELGEQITDPLRAGVLTQLETIGISYSQNPNQTIDNSLVMIMEKGEVKSVDQKKKVFDPSKKLNDMKIYMAYLEWYKKGSKAQNIGYYDSYKNSYTLSDKNIFLFKKKLTNYWKKMVAEVEKRPQKEGAAFRTRWLYSGTNYRRMVEPLDIADYYKDKHSKDYMTRGRSEHYIQLEKWQKEDKNPNNANEREFACSLTEDSCFWAHVEEAIISCYTFNNDGSSPADRESSFKKLVDFECYVTEKKLAISPEIFLVNSSFMWWWKEYEKIAREMSYLSKFIKFMNGYEYKSYVSA